MTPRDQINAFNSDLIALINRYRKEFDLPYASVIGVLQLNIIDLANEALDE